MNVYRWAAGLFAAASLSLLMAGTALAQTETLGIVRYTAPQGWTKTPKGNVVGYSTIDQAKGTFCIITLHGATPGTGDAKRDFAREWKNLVVTPLKAETDPKTETQAANGWTLTSGAASIEFQGGKSLALLTVFSGFAKTISVLAVFSDPSYVTALEKFVGSIVLEKPVVGAPPPSVSTGPGTFGTVTYKAPSGWTEQRLSDGVVFQPSDLPAGDRLILQILPPLRAAGTLEQALARSYDDAAALYRGTKMNEVNGGNYNVRKPKTSFLGWEYIRGSGSIQTENGTPYKDEFGLDLFVIRMSNRSERVAVLKSRRNCNLSRYFADDRLSYHRDIENFLFSLKFSDWKQPALANGTLNGSGGIVGVWQGISLAVGASSVGEPLGVRYKVFSPIFFANGQAYFGAHFPSEGLDGFSSRIAAESNTRDWGTYTFQDGKGVLKMPYANIPLRMEKGKLIITPNKTDHGFYRLQTVGGATFDGTYTLSEVNGKIPAITFTPDGRFADNGALKVLYHEYVECVNPAVVPGLGTYVVRDYTVIFNYTDGRKIKLAFLGAGYVRGKPTPGKLRLSSNEDELTRR